MLTKTDFISTSCLFSVFALDGSGASTTLPRCYMVSGRKISSESVNVDRSIILLSVVGNIQSVRRHCFAAAIRDGKISSERDDDVMISHGC